MIVRARPSSGSHGRGAFLLSPLRKGRHAQSCAQKARVSHEQFAFLYFAGKRNNQLIRSSVGPEQCLPSQVLAFRMAALDEQDIMSARILQYLWHAECPECGSVGTHDGDCTRDWWLPGRGLFGDSPLFRGTELFGLTSLAKAILARETTETEDATRSGARLLPASAVRRPALQNLAP